MDRNSLEFIELLVENRFRKHIGEEDYKEYKWAEDFLKKTNKYGFRYLGDYLDLYKAQEIAERLQYKFGTKSESETRDNHTTKHYIWRTQDDDKVRSGHAHLDDRVFSWDEVPPGGKYPGEDYNCRC